MKKVLPLLLVVSGCIETGISSSVEPVGVANPKDLATPDKVDKLVQVQVPEVDVLWVIDNSCSMWEEQTALTENFPIFMNFFLGSGLDYHIGVVSTDMNNAAESGRLRQANGYRYIDEETENPTSIFTSMAAMGTAGHFDEKGREAAYAALELKKDGYNVGFLRDDASLHVVVISDENDHSDTPAIGEFVNYLTTLKWSEDMVTFSSIVSPDPVCPDASEVGAEYSAVTNAVGGIHWSICSTEWGALLEQLGIQASGLKREYFLSALPVPDSITVSVVEGGVTYTFLEGDVEAGGDWTYNSTRNSVTFNEYVPGALAEVYVEYKELSAFEEGVTE
jgi:hypothetical protein